MDWEVVGRIGLEAGRCVEDKGKDEFKNLVTERFIENIWVERLGRL